MNAAWRAFIDELARSRDAGCPARFWWRDDDAHMPTPALAGLLALRAAAQVPLALAVIPEEAVPALFGEIGPGISVLQHGTDHVNRAGRGEKKTEFSIHESVGSALARLRASRARLADLSRGRALPVLVPPWNRIPAALAAEIGLAGFRGLSTYDTYDTHDTHDTHDAGTFAARPPGHPATVVQVHTHLDIIAWREGRGFAGEEQVLRQAIRRLAYQRSGDKRQAGPIGWLTHHAVHDDAAQRFLEQLLEITRNAEGVTWADAEQLFAEPAVAVPGRAEPGRTEPGLSAA